jgi:rRNA maturation endonuclease Nob1
MLVCPNCNIEIDLSDVGEVCTNCGVQIPLDMESEESEEIIEEEPDDSVTIEEF